MWWVQWREKKLRLIKLEINNLRGIRNLTISPEGDNVVISGPNGSGKSAVVDAIDFILSGNMTRLAGEGTGDIRLGKYGAHIMESNTDSWVRGVFQIPSINDPVSVKRSIASPSQLICEPASAKPMFEIIEAYARLGQHIVTRREIIRFILSKPKTRAEAISSLLEMSSIESSRAVTVKVRGKLEQSVMVHRNAIQASVNQIVSTAEMDEYVESELIKIINALRGELSASPLTTLTPSIVDDVKNPISEALERPSEVTNLDETIGGIKEVLADDSLSTVSLAERKMSESITLAQSINNFKRILQTRKLVALGLGLVGNYKSCPLCDVEWEPDSLRTYLEEKTKKSTNAKRTADEIDKHVSRLKEIVGNLVTRLQAILSVAKLVELDITSMRLIPWKSSLDQLLASLENPIDDYRVDSKEVARLFTTGSEVDEVGRIHDTARKAYPDPAEIELCWKKLIQLQENIAALFDNITNEKKAAECYELARKLVDHFEGAIESVLDSLYGEISQRFSDMYRTLHGPDEPEFDAAFIREGAGLKILTEFHNQGSHPPSALHSEGHQDSMGLVMHLALRERITAGKLSLVALDDVIMSIDVSHRKSVCHLLHDLSENNQFIITTHDRAWANYLRSEGVVKKQNMVEFYNWSLEAGPRVNVGLDMWDKIFEHLKNDRMIEAAGLLRHGLEQFFEDMCDTLEAKITFQSTGIYNLGDYLPAANSRILELLRRAAKMEEKLKNTDKATQIIKQRDEIVQAYASTNAEIWTINRTLHYNNWANLSSNELGAHVITFKRHCELFLCQLCGFKLFLTKKNGRSVGLRCQCGDINLTLSD